MSSRRLVGIAVLAGVVVLAIVLAPRLADLHESPKAPATGDDGTTSHTPPAPALTGQGTESPAISAPTDGRRGEIHGRLLDATTGEPVAGARVQVFAHGTGQRAATRSDAKGRYGFPDVDPAGGAVALVVDAEGRGRTLQSRVVPGALGEKVAVHAGGWIQGRVLDTEGGVPTGLEILPLYRLMARPGTFSVHEPLVRLALPPDLAESPTRYALATDGPFRIGPLAAGVYGLLLLPTRGPPQLELAGGETYERSAGFSVDARKTTDAGTLTLAPLGHALVRVLDASADDPLPGVTFAYEMTLDRRGRSYPATGVESTAEGSYEVPLTMHRERARAVSHTIRVSCEGYLPSSLSFGGQQSGAVFTVRLLRDSSRAALHGRVLDEEGRPIPSALILIRGDATRVGRATATSDARGQYAIGDLPPDLSMEVIVLAPHLETVLTIVPITLERGENRALDLGGPVTTALSVEVRHSGAPLEGAFLSLDTPDGRRTQFQSGSDGRVRFDGIPPGPCELFVSILEERALQTRPVQVERDKVTHLLLDFRHEVRGVFELQDATGVPMEIEDYFKLAARRIGAEDGVVTEGPVAKDGTFAFLLTTPGTYALEPIDWADPVELVVSPDIEVRDSETTEDLEVVWRMAPKNGRIEIAVFQAEDGEPIAEGDYGYRWQTTRGGAVFTEGRVVEQGCGLGEHVFEVMAEGRAPETITVELTTEAMNVRREVRLQKSNGVRFTEFTGDSRAKAAGLLPGDVLLEYGETRVFHVGDLRAALRKTTPEDDVRLTILRDDRKMQIDVPGGRMGVRLRNTRVKE